MLSKSVLRLSSLSSLRCINLRMSSNSTGNCPPQSPPKPAEINADVPGLSEKCVKSKNQPIGPGASTQGEYKVPEYFCYDKTSYAEAEIEMASYRCPQPSALK